MIVKEDSKEFYKIQHKIGNNDWTFSIVNSSNFTKFNYTNHHGTGDLEHAKAVLQKAIEDNGSTHDFRIVKVKLTVEVVTLEEDDNQE